LGGDQNSLHTAADFSPFHIRNGMIAVVIGKEPEVRGIVQYVGQTTFASGYWVGLKLETPTGKNDGSIEGTQYFECPPYHGLFVRPGQLKILPEEEDDNQRTPEHHSHQSQSHHHPHSEYSDNLIDGITNSTSSRRSDDGIIRTNADTLRETLNTAYALKVKLAKSMNLLNRQLETIEFFEGRVESLTGVVDDDCVDFVSSIYDLLNEEERLIAEFRTYLPNVSNASMNK
jgi:hypothetical protein